MSCEKDGHDVNRIDRVQIPQRLEHLDLVFGGQSVSAFCFHGGRAQRKQGVEVPFSNGDQLLFTGAAGSLNCRFNAAPFGGNLLVRSSGEA